MADDLVRLVLPRALLRRLDRGSVFCQTAVTVERQSRAGRWVLRGVESGGGTREVGRYISFFSSQGERLPWLQRLDRIGANGAHAVVVGEGLLSVEMARVGQTFQLLIARHGLAYPNGTNKRPRRVSKILFRGFDGQLPPELLKQGLAPEFFTRSGEVQPIPEQFVDAVKLVAGGAACRNCRHCHGLVSGETPPR